MSTTVVGGMGLARPLPLLLGLLLVVVQMPSALALDAQGRGLIYGMGMRSCPEASQRARVEGSAAAWVQGYLSASNRWMPETYAITMAHISTVLDWLEAYCQQHPHKTLFDAVEAYMQEAFPTRQTQEPTPVLPRMPLR